MSNKPAKILIVDDSSLVRIQIKKILAAENYHEIAEAENSCTAIEQFTSFQPDITLLDLLLPDFDGVVTAQAIRRIHPYARIIVITQLRPENELVHIMETKEQVKFILHKPIHDSVQTMMGENVPEMDLNIDESELTLDKQIEDPTKTMHVRFDGKTQILYLHDIVDTAEADNMFYTALAFLPYSYSNVLINLSGVKSITEKALQILKSSPSLLGDFGARVYFTALNPEIRRLFNASDDESRVNIYSLEKEALKAIGS